MSEFGFSELNDLQDDGILVIGNIGLTVGIAFSIYSDNGKISSCLIILNCSINGFIRCSNFLLRVAFEIYSLVNCNPEIPGSFIEFILLKIMLKKPPEIFFFSVLLDHFCFLNKIRSFSGSFCCKIDCKKIAYPKRSP